MTGKNRDTIVAEAAERMWAGIDDKGIRGRLYREDCDYLAELIADMLAQPPSNRFHEDPAENP